MDITIGKRKTLTSALVPANIPAEGLVWESSAPEIAAAFDNGNVVAKAKGIATITVKDSGGKVLGSCTVNAVSEPAKVSTPPVKVTGGQISGYYAHKNKDILIYKGVPFAAPPTGQNRWRAPQDIVPWNGVKDCTEFGPCSIQAGLSTIETSLAPEYDINYKAGVSEDCLTLNIWTKSGSSTKKPVVFYIPGGAWMAGGSSCEIFDGEYLSTQDVVFVSTNYRLGFLGWFASNELAAEDKDGSSGNYGLMDLIKGLEWVRDNIASFGGDPGNVTLYGGSAGANLISTLIASPKAKGLFRRGVSMSFPDIGQSNTPLKERLEGGDKFVAANGGLEMLRSLSADKILELSFPAIMGRLAGLGPCNDGVYVDKDYRKALESGYSADVDLITGMAWNDANEPGGGDALFLFGADKKFPGATPGELLAAYGNAVVLARKKGGATGNTFICEHNQLTPDTQGKSSATHGGDAIYMLNNLTDMKEGYWRESDFEACRVMSAYFINFCRTGNPSGKDANGKNLVEWKPAEGDYTYFRLSAESKEIKMPEDKLKIVSEFAKELKNPDLLAAMAGI